MLCCHGKQAPAGVACWWCVAATTAAAVKTATACHCCPTATSTAAAAAAASTATAAAAAAASGCSHLSCTTPVQRVLTCVHVYNCCKWALTSFVYDSSMAGVKMRASARSTATLSSQKRGGTTGCGTPAHMGRTWAAATACSARTKPLTKSLHALSAQLLCRHRSGEAPPAVAYAQHTSSSKVRAHLV